jgi:hypothetical protein
MPDTRVTRRFFIASAVMIAALAAVVVIGITGLERVGQANDQVSRRRSRVRVPSLPSREQSHASGGMRPSS